MLLCDNHMRRYQHNIKGEMMNRMSVRRLAGLGLAAVLSISALVGGLPHALADGPVTGVTLSDTSISVPVGYHFQLVPYINPVDADDLAVSWDSDDTSVATVDGDGNVIAVAVGTATITVTTDDGGFTATCEVTVTAATVDVTGVSLDYTDWSMLVGDDFQLTATVEPNDATNQDVTWESDDTSVATVDSDGHVTAVGPGTAIITVTTDDGAFTDSCEVTVIRDLTGVVVSPKTLDITIGGTALLTATVQPSDASNKHVSWESSDPTIATVDQNGMVTALKLGTVTITATAGDGQFTDTATVRVVPVVHTGGSVAGSPLPWAMGISLAGLALAGWYMRRRFATV